MKRSMSFLCFVLFLALHYDDPLAYGTEGRLTPHILDTRSVQVTIKAATAFDNHLKRIIVNGIPVHAVFTIKLYQHVGFWFDKKIALLTIDHVLTYDNLKDVYSIAYGNQNTPPAEVDDLRKAELLVSSIENLTITTQELIDLRNNYYVAYTVDVVADTENSHLPFYLDYLVNILPGRNEIN